VVGARDLNNGLVMTQSFVHRTHHEVIIIIIINTLFITLTCKP